MAKLLEIQDLQTLFYTSAGTVKAVDEISYDVEEGETVAIVGESGCGKSVSALSILRLIANPPGEITGGKINFMGQDLLQLSDREIREIRGRDISMIFQEPMTSLNPVLTIWGSADRGNGVSSRNRHRRSRKQSGQVARNGGDFGTPKKTETVSASFQRRNAPKGDDRHGFML